MHLEAMRIKPTRRRWLPIGRVMTNGRLCGLCLCWWTGAVIVEVRSGRRRR